MRCRFWDLLWKIYQTLQMHGMRANLYLSTRLIIFQEQTLQKAVRFLAKDVIKVHSGTRHPICCLINGKQNSLKIFDQVSTALRNHCAIVY